MPNESDGSAGPEKKNTRGQKKGLGGKSTGEPPTSFDELGTSSTVPDVAAAATALSDIASLRAGAISAIQRATQLPPGTLSALQQATQLPPGTLSALQQATSMWAGIRNTQGQSAIRDWTDVLNRTLGPAKPVRVRRRRSATEFFAAFEAEVSSVPELLRALAVTQAKNSHLGLVWRGHQDANWAVDSSLTRRLREDGHELGEDQMAAVERFQMGAADRWGIPHLMGDLNFLAELQHEGVPTRLIDVSLDPEVAVWFAVQESEAHDEQDGRVVIWGRSPAPKRNKPVGSPVVIPAAGGDAFWQLWEDQDVRRSHEWGTGRAVPSWQPSALNERMRAQRAAFLFDAEPIVDGLLLQLFSDSLDADWRGDEIAKATRIIGFPSRHDKVAKSNAAGIVPMFSLRIKASTKREVRNYLEGKGLAEETIYPDRAGLVSFLRRMSAR